MKYTIFFIFAIHLFACNFQPKPIDVDLPEPPQKLVVSSFLVPPQEAILTLTRTFTALVDDDSLDLQDSTNATLINRIFVEDGMVRIENRGAEKELFELAPSIYASVEVEQHFGESYRLYAKDFLTGEEVTAETVLLPQIDFDSLFSKKTILPNLGDTLRTFEIQFNDTANVENYYLVTYSDIATFQDASNNLGTSLFSQNNTQFNIFADAEYGDGNRIRFSPNPGDVIGDTLVVGLSNITKGYFEFLSAYKRSGGVLTQLTGEPINLPSNVVGGYGYFAMILPKLGVVVLE